MRRAQDDVRGGGPPDLLTRKSPALCGGENSSCGVDVSPQRVDFCAPHGGSIFMQVSISRWLRVDSRKCSFCETWRIRGFAPFCSPLFCPKHRPKGKGNSGGRRLGDLRKIRRAGRGEWQRESRYSKHMRCYHTSKQSSRSSYLLVVRTPMCCGVFE
jgi:hypothetical protein